MKLNGGIWHNEFPTPLYDTGKKTDGWPDYRKRPIYKYAANLSKPMTFQVSSTFFVRPRNSFFTDLGSVPEILQLIVSKDLHNPSFVMHDDVCKQHGLWFSSTLDGTYVFCKITSERAAEILGMGLYAAGYPKRAQLVYYGVKDFGPQWRMKKEQPETKEVK